MGKKFVIFFHHALSAKALVLSSLLQRLHDGVDGASSSVAVTDVEAQEETTTTWT